MPSNMNERGHVSTVNTGNSNRTETRDSLLTTTTTTTTVVETKDNYMVIVPGNRDNWSNRVVYLLSIIGFVVDLGKLFCLKKRKLSNF